MELSDYQRYLEESGFVDSSRSGYYVNWVRKFLRFHFPPGLRSDARVGHFIEELSFVPGMEEWKLRQARHAVEIYLNLYLKPSGGGRGSESEVHPDFAELAEKFRTVIRLKHYSFRTEKTYYEWIRRYLAYCAKTGKKYRFPHSVKSFLTALAVKDEVAASTQNQAFNAILFLFREVLEIQLDGIAGAVRAKAKRRLPVVLTPDEVRMVLDAVSGTRRLMLELIYGTGLRVSELTRLRVMDLDFDGGVLRVHDGKGGKDRAVPLPKRLDEPLKKHLERVRELHDQDLSIGLGEVYIPPALARKYPGAGKEWRWQYVFPSSRLSVDPRSGLTRRHHVLDKSVQDAMRGAVKAAGIPKRATVHTLRHSFATHLLMGGVNIREVQDLLGHKNLETTMIYTHVLRDISNAPASPLDSLWED